jgi:hypothetical protein
MAVMGSPAWAAGSGKVLAVTGSAEVDGRAARIGNSVPSEALLVTGPDSFLEVLTPEGAVVRVYPESNVRLSGSSFRRRIDLFAGSLANFVVRTGRRLGAARARSFEIRTPTVVAGVRGTAFFVGLEQPGQTYLCICNGVLHMEHPAGKDLGTIEAAHHHAFRYQKAGPEASTSEAPGLYHDDGVMEALARRVNRKIDWSRIPK